MAQTSKQSLLSFNAGELTPKLESRVDIEKYRFGCRKLRNFLPTIYGSVGRREGLKFVNPTRYSSNDVTEYRLIPFIFNRDTSYVLEVGGFYIWFYENGSQQFFSPGVPLAVTTPYSDSELFDIQVAQLNDVVYFCHPNHAPRKLIRLSDSSWDFQVVDAAYPPMLDQNTEPTTINPTGTTGSITLNASTGIFDADHVGSVWEIGHYRDTNFIRRDIGANGTTGGLRILGPWRFSTSGTWDADIKIRQSRDGGTVWENLRTYTSKNDKNFDDSGETDELVLTEIVVSDTSTSTGQAFATLEALDSFRRGVVKITGFNSSTQVAADVIEPLYSSDATTFWSEPAWSDLRGYPRAVAFFEQRLWFAGTNHQANTLWASRTGDYENFLEVNNATGSLNYTVASKENNAIQWMAPTQQLIIGTVGGEWIASGGSESEAITPSDFRITPQSNYGSSEVDAIKIDDVLIFVQRIGRKLLEYKYSFNQDSYSANDLTSLAEHITTSGIKQIAYQQQPYSRVWALMNDGTLAVLTFEKEQEVYAWSIVETDGTFESIAIVPEDNADTVYCVVRRTINGSGVRHIETIETTDNVSKEDSFYVDSGIQYDGVATTTVSGLDHLEAEEVTALADGNVYSGLTVNSSGEITLPIAASKVSAGLPYTSKIQPMNIDTDPANGIIQGNYKRISGAILSLRDSLGATIIVDGKDCDIPFSSNTQTMDSSPPLFTGRKQTQINSGHSFDPTFIIEQRQPLPMNLESIVVKYQISEL